MVSPKDPVVDMVDLRKSFGENHVLRKVSMHVHPGEKNVTVLSKSGSGKSVLVKCIVKLLDPGDGVIRLPGHNLADLDQDELDALHAHVGFLFQSSALYDSLNVRENLEFPLRRHWTTLLDSTEAEMVVHEALNDVGLAHTTDTLPVELSGSLRKRIALARTLILRPSLILYDEPKRAGPRDIEGDR